MPIWNGRFTTKLHRFAPSPAARRRVGVGVRAVAQHPSWHPARPERGEGSNGMKWFVCHIPLMPRDGHFSYFIKISNQKQATPTIVPGLRRGRL